MQRKKWESQKRWSAGQEAWEKEESFLLELRQGHRKAIKKSAAAEEDNRTAERVVKVWKRKTFLGRVWRGGRRKRAGNDGEDGDDGGSEEGDDAVEGESAVADDEDEEGVDKRSGKDDDNDGGDAGTSPRSGFAVIDQEVTSPKVRCPLPPSLLLS